ncbi:MAG: ABC transporter permease subunit [Tissierellia bacterium]|nr:ABC transporter permease subunit [Tissierellia bacterium]
MLNEYLYDHLGRSYPRKNQYLAELWKLEDAYKKEPTTVLKEKISDFKKAKDNHPYNLALKEFEIKEKAYLNEKKQLLLEEEKRHPNFSPDILKLIIEEKSAMLDQNFYASYENLSYDALYGLDNAKARLRILPEVIRRLSEIEEDIKLISEKEVTSFIENKDSSTIVEDKIHLEKALKDLKEKKSEGLISEKALTNRRKELKKEYKYKQQVKKLDDPLLRKQEELRSKKFERENFLKTSKRLLKDDLADVRRNTPVEVYAEKKYLPWLTLPFPGLGQLILGQKTKAMLFLIATLFIYFAAIPYALGFGNYQGQGISGLISLATSGKRTDRSIIFMIEGIIALTLLTISLITYIFSFLDVRKVEKQMVEGQRPRNWFETKSALLEEGFPYLVSLPALFVIVFIVLVPIMTTILLSFTNMGPKTQSKFPWVGLSNYKMLLAGQGLVGSVFWKISLWTIIWTLGATTLAITLGFLLALLAHNPRIKGKGFLRIIYILPWAVPAFITIMFFSIMFSTGGELNMILSKLLGRSVDVKNSMVWTRLVLILLQGWLGSSYIFLLSTGVLQAIPEDLYEAAEIDGANSWQKMLRITLPIVLFQTAPLLVNQYTFNFNNFSIIYLFNGGGPFSPLEYGNLAGSSDILISYIYKLTINNQYQSIGAAVSIVISVGLMFIAFLGYKNTKAFKEERL